MPAMEAFPLPVSYLCFCGTNGCNTYPYPYSTLLTQTNFVEEILQANTHPLEDKA